MLESPGGTTKSADGSDDASNDGGTWKAGLSNSAAGGVTAAEGASA